LIFCDKKRILYRGPAPEENEDEPHPPDRYPDTRVRSPVSACTGRQRLLWQPASGEVKAEGSKERRLERERGLGRECSASGRQPNLLSPSVGYMPFKKFIVGVGGIYNYVSLRSYYGDYSQSIFGTHTFARYTVGSGFFLQAQYDRLLQPDHMSPEPNDKAWVDYLMIGGGFIQSVNDKLALTTSIMYNIHHNPLSIYPSRLIIQFGVTGSF
jgi:hypothetical protein